MTTIPEYRAHQVYGYPETEDMHVNEYDTLPRPLSMDGLVNSFAYRQGLRRGVELAKMPYQNYLRTREWRDTRQLAIEAANGACQRCGDTRRLEVHHTDYDHRGFETLDDLEVLCNPCHRNHHGTTP